MKKQKKYRLKDIEQIVNRDKTTLIRWEKKGLIPTAKRDERNWRYYSKLEMREVVNKILQSNYFRG